MAGVLGRAGRAVAARHARYATAKKKHRATANAAASRHGAGTPAQLAGAAKKAVAGSIPAATGGVRSRAGRAVQRKAWATRAAVRTWARAKTRIARRKAKAWIGTQIRAAVRAALAKAAPAPTADSGVVDLGQTGTADQLATHGTVGTTVDSPASAGGTIGAVMATIGSALGQMLKDKAGELAGATNGWEPTGMLEYVGTVDSLEGTILAVADMVDGLYKGAGNLPLESSAIEAIGMIVRALHAAAATAAQASNTLKVVHEADLARLATPRRNEALWDVRANS